MGQGGFTGPGMGKTAKEGWSYFLFMFDDSVYVLYVSDVHQWTALDLQYICIMPLNFGVKCINRDRFDVQIQYVFKVWKSAAMMKDYYVDLPNLETLYRRAELSFDVF